MTVNDWVKLGITIAGFAIVTWSTVQNLEYRVDKVEGTLESHLIRHDSQSAEIQQTLKRIEIELTRLQK
jgi:hypothetical protein